MKTGRYHILYLITAAFLFLASVGIPVYSHTCLMSGKTDSALAFTEQCCGGKTDANCSSCCIQDTDYQVLETENIVPPGFDLHSLNPGLALMDHLLPDLHSGYVESVLHTLYKDARPPPLANREVHIHYSVFRI